MVAKASIERRASVPVLISPLYLPHLGQSLHRPIENRDGQLWCPISKAPMSTEFAISRFCVPFIQREGWALFADCDILCTADIAELFALADDRYAVMVVKHEQLPAVTPKRALDDFRCPTCGHNAVTHDLMASGCTLSDCECRITDFVIETETKMGGQIQTYYSRKNWSSVVLWNCSHPSHIRLRAMDRLNQWPGRDLHAFKWLEDYEIGELPSEWNYLVGIDSGAAKIWHYTLGGPFTENWQGGEFDDLWEREAAALNRVGFLAD